MVRFMVMVNHAGLTWMYHHAPLVIVIRLLQNVLLVLGVVIVSPVHVVTVFVVQLHLIQILLIHMTLIHALRLEAVLYVVHQEK